MRAGSRTRRPARKCAGMLFSPTTRMSVAAFLAFFYLIELSVLSGGLTNSVELSSAGVTEGLSDARMVSCSKMGFGISLLQFLLLLGLLILSWFDYQRYESYLLVSNSCIFGLTMGFLMTSYQLLYSPQANGGLFACNFLIVLFFPAMDILDLRPIASLGLEEGFNLMRRARDTKALSTAFDSISVTIDGDGDGDGDGDAERDELEQRQGGGGGSKLEIETRARSVSSRALRGSLRAVDADTYYSPPSSVQSEGAGTGTGTGGGPAGSSPMANQGAHRQARRTSRLGLGSSSSAIAMGPGNNTGPDDFVTISFAGDGAGQGQGGDAGKGQGGGGSMKQSAEPPLWWDGPSQTAKASANPNSNSSQQAGPRQGPSRPPEKVPEVSSSSSSFPSSSSPPSSSSSSSSSSVVSPDDPTAFDGFRLRLERMPLSLRNPPNVQHNLTWDAFVNIAHRIDSSSCHIYTAYWESARRQVIIKLIKADRVHIPMAVSEFESEATVLSRISHPHIVKLLGTGTQPRRFLVLELLDGGSLSHLMGLRPDAHNRVSRKRFTYLETLYLSRDLASALDYLHSSWHPIAHIVHRDLKPDNIGWTSDGCLKLFDFGLCTVIKANCQSHQGYTLTGNTGTLRYMAPEVAVGKPYHHSVDTYSFGIIVWQVLTGVVPFRDLGRKKYYEKVVYGGARPSCDPQLPPAFRQLLERCWHPDLNARPKFAEVLAVLDDLVAEQERVEAEGWRYAVNRAKVAVKDLQRLLVQWRLPLLLLCSLLGVISIAAFDEGDVQSGVALGILSSWGLYLFGISTIRAHIRNDGARRGFCGGAAAGSGAGAGGAGGSGSSLFEAAVVGLELGAASRRVRSGSGSGSGSGSSDKRQLLGWPQGAWSGGSSGGGASTRGSEHLVYGVNF